MRATTQGRTYGVFEGEARADILCVILRSEVTKDLIGSGGC